MNCNELKNLLSECENLAELDQTPDAAAHLKNCAGCQSAFAYEGKLRQGFAGIASEAAPPDLAARIMAIQSEQSVEIAHATESAEPGWFDQLLRSLQGFPFKVAFAAGLTGFFAAFLILRQPQLAPGKEASTMTARQDQATPVTRRNEMPQLAKTEEKLIPSSDEKSLLFETQHAKKQRASEKGAMQLAMTPKEESAAGADRIEVTGSAASVFEASNETEADASAEERIPGAMTFALDSSADTFVADKSAGAGAAAVTLADQPAASEPEMQLAMSPSADREVSKSVRPSAPARFATQPPAGEMRDRLSASQIMSESKSKKFDLSGEMLAETGSSDPLAEELLELIEANAIDLPEGFISLDELAMRGYLPSEKLRRLRPPTGNGWYLQKTAGHLRIFLKKR